MSNAPDNSAGIMPSQDMTLFDPTSLSAMSQAADAYQDKMTLNQMLENQNPSAQYTMNKQMWTGGPTYAEGIQYGTAGIAAVGDIWNGYNQMQAANTQASFLDQESQINLQRATQTVGSILGPEESFQLGEVGPGYDVFGDERFAGKEFDLEPDAELVFVRPDGPHFGA